MSTVSFREFLFEQGFSFTNEGKTQYFHKKEAKFKVFIKGEKIEVKGEILDFPDTLEKAEAILKDILGEKEPKKPENKDNSSLI